MSHGQKWDWVDVIWLLAALAFVAIVLFPFLTPFLLYRVGPLSPDSSNYLLVVEKSLTFIMCMFAVLWIFFLGGTFASFLNVVASRVPQGISILGSSHCPHCSVKLSFRDNIPFVGWTRNRGRCSKCREPISIRYLLVEIALGLIFLFIVLLEWGSGGVSLPIRESKATNEWYRMLLEPGNDLIPVVGFHLTMICLLFAFVLVELDNQKIPQSLLTVGIGLGSTIAIIWPSSILLQWNFPQTESLFPSSRAAAIISLALGLCAGTAMGWLIGWFQAFSSERPTVGAKAEPNFRKQKTSGQSAFGLAAVGLFLGWQSVLVVGPLWLVTLSIVSKLHQKSFGLAADLPNSGPETKQENACIPDADNNVGYQVEQQITADRLNADSAMEQAVTESKADAGWANQLAALPHAWLLVIVLIHLSTWRWMILLR